MLRRRLILGVASADQARLQIREPYPMDKDDLRLAPNSYVEGTRFYIPSLCAACGGRTMSFASQYDLDKMRDHYARPNETAPGFSQWVFSGADIVVQITGRLPEDIARRYENVLAAMQ